MPAIWEESCRTTPHRMAGAGASLSSGKLFVASGGADSLLHRDSIFTLDGLAWRRAFNAGFICFFVALAVSALLEQFGVSDIDWSFVVGVAIGGAGADNDGIELDDLINVVCDNGYSLRIADTPGKLVFEDPFPPSLLVSIAAPPI